MDSFESVTLAYEDWSHEVREREGESSLGFDSIYLLDNTISALELSFITIRSMVSKCDKGWKRNH